MVNLFLYTKKLLGGIILKNNKFKNQILKQTIAYILIVFILVAIITSYILYASNKNNYLAQNSRFLDIMNNQIQHLLIHPEKELKFIENISQTTKNNMSESEEIKFILNNSLYLERVEYLNEEGIIVDTYPYNNKLIGNDYSGNPFFSGAISIDQMSVYYGSTFIDPVSGNISMTITLKTRNNNYLVGYLNLQTLEELINGVEFKNSTYVILDKKGRYITHPNHDYVNERRVNNEFEMINNGILLNGKILKHNGVISILQWQKVSSTGWTLLIYQDIKNMVKQIYITLTIFLIAFFIILLVTVTSLNHNLKKVDNVLLDFIGITKKASKGNYEIKLPHYPYVEFQKLFSDFRHMIEEVEIREEEIYKLNSQLEENYLRTVFLLAKTIEAKDAYTGDHCDRVRKFALLIGKKINLNDHDTEQLSIGSLLHDIGKLAIPEKILTKPGKLLEEEYMFIKQHSQFGYELIKEIPNMDKAKEIVLYHHESYDGNGYPKGLKGEEIPLLARIVCIADAYDAMTSKRIYKSRPMTQGEAIEELRRCSNKQFDSKLVEAFIEATLEKTMDNISDSFNLHSNK